MSFVPSDGKAEKCAGCGKTAYPNERISACGTFWHKICLKCTSCGLALNLKTIESFENKPYCKVHKPTVGHHQVASITQQTAAAAPKVNKVSGIRKDERMTFAPGAAPPVRGGAPGGPARGGPGPARGAPAKAAPGGPARGAPPAAAPKTSSAPGHGMGIGVPKISGGGGNKCPACGKTVYPTEEVRACAASWHKTCLKCTECSLVLNLKTVESFQNKPYCKTHKPNPKHTQVTDSVASQQVKNAPKAARAVGSVKKDTRMTFAPGAMRPVTTAEVVNPGGVVSVDQHSAAPTRTYVPPTPAASMTYGDSNASYQQASYDEPADSGYGGYGDSNASYEEPASSGGYEEQSGGYEEQSGGYEEQAGGYEDQGDQGGYEDQGGYDQGGYEDQGYDQGGYDQGGYEDQGYDQGEEQWQ